MPKAGNWIAFRYAESDRYMIGFLSNINKWEHKIDKSDERGFVYYELMISETGYEAEPGMFYWKYLPVEVLDIIEVL